MKSDMQNSTSEPTQEVPVSNLDAQITEMLDTSDNTESLIKKEGEEKEVSVETPSKESEKSPEPSTPETSSTPTTVKPSVEPPTSTPTEVSEVDGLKAQIAALTEQLNKLASLPVKPQESPKEVDLGIQELLDKMDFDQVMDSKEAFVNFMTSALKAVSKATLGQVNEVVPQVITHQTSMEKVRNDFYTANPELNAVKPYVAQVANTVASEHPDWTVAQVLTEAAKVTRVSLGIPTTPTASTTTSKTKPPVLPGGSQSTRKPSVKGSQLQEAIDDFLND